MKTFVTDSEVTFLAFRKIFNSLSCIREAKVSLNIPSFGSSHIPGFRSASFIVLHARDLNNYQKLFLLLEQNEISEVFVVEERLSLAEVLRPGECGQLSSAVLAWLPGILHNMKYAPFDGEGAACSTAHQYNAGLIAPLLDAADQQLSGTPPEVRQAFETVVRIVDGTLDEDDSMEEAYYNSVSLLEVYLAQIRRNRAREKCT